MTAATIGRVWHALNDSEVWERFLASRSAMVSAALCVVIVLAALLAPWLSPQDPYDSAALDLLDSFLPPAWLQDGRWDYPLGTDDQGRDMLSAIFYGLRTSLLVGVAAVVFAIVVGVPIGLISGFVGGKTDMLLMRVADIQLSFPGILVALIVDGFARSMLPAQLHNDLAIYVLIVAIGLSKWVPFARAIRGSTMVEKNKEYVLAARLLGRHPAFTMARHILPNVMGPVLVLATINLAVAVLNEATLSFLGVGMPPTQPSLGALIYTGQKFLMSGEWWIVLLPGAVLATLVLAVNILGDWLRNVFNPKLR